jgi:glycosyltransferase involved in cell wall biosynthesis
MIVLPEHDLNMRAELNIPEDAVVFGGYGGEYQFSIPFAQKVVYEVAKSNPTRIFFLFANFRRFCPELPNIIHLPTIYDPSEKTRFINTADAMLWARHDGETFGLAIGEFSVRNKPVIAMDIGSDCHVQILRDKGVWYNDADSLQNILLNFDVEAEKTKDWNAYRKFSPENVMRAFRDVFLG